MSRIFYELYLKYKTKYLNLKNNQQIGGNIENPINIVSFNVLNPNFNYSQYLFKNYSEQIKQIYLNQITNNELNTIIKNLVKIEKKEFELYRKNKLLLIIQSWIKSDQIVCLQEVNNELLKNLIKIYKKNITSTQNLTNHTDDYRVIIVPESYQIIKTDILVFDNGIKIKECLITHIQDSNKKELVIFNLHIHWQSQELDYTKFANQIKKYLEPNLVPFIICGDFNSSINSIFMTNFIDILNKKFKLDRNNIKYSSDFTSHDTKNKNQMSWIDHILSYKLIVHSPTQTTNQINNFEIFYNTNKAIQQIVSLNKSIIKTKEFRATKENIQIFNSLNYISDHKPVFASFFHII